MLSSSQPNSISLSLGANTSVTTTSKQLRKFLQFQLGGKERALLEAEIVTEIIIVPESQILPVPQMPYCVIGIYSWRSEMLWIVDLENLLGYASSISTATQNLELVESNFMVMVVEVKGQSLGLIVPNVSDIIQLDWQELKPPSSELFAEDIQAFLQGYFTDSNQEILMLLNAEKFLQDF